MAPRLHSAALVVLVVVVTVCSMDVAHAEKEKCNGRKGLSKCPSYPNAITTCENGLCSATCEPGYGNCNGDMSGDGCETFIAGVNGSNCGGCGTECKEDQFPSSKASCTNGMCGNLLCNTGYADCNGMVEDGCEVDTYRDPLQCGACGSACPRYPSAITTCEDGHCSHQCMLKNADCNGDMTSDGCETFTGESLANCGGCGVQCPGYPNAYSSCEDSECAAVCQQGYRNCNGDMAGDGCEVQTYNDVGNCGACGITCPKFPNAVPRCWGGRCSSDCRDDFTQCYPGNIDARGCTNLVDDSKNCGQCGTECAADQFCYLSECVTAIP